MRASGCCLHDLLGRFDAFHLRHGDVHEHDVGMGAVVFGDGGQAVSGFARDLAAESFDHAGQILAREDGVVHDQVADWLPVFAAFYWCKLLHNNLLLLTRVPYASTAGSDNPNLAGAGGLAARVRARTCFLRVLHAHCAMQGAGQALPGPPPAWHSRVRWPLWACR